MGVHLFSVGFCLVQVCLVRTAAATTLRLILLSDRSRKGTLGVEAVVFAGGVSLGLKVASERSYSTPGHYRIVCRPPRWLSHLPTYRGGDILWIY
jgi:hypothetical protein